MFQAVCRTIEVGGGFGAVRWVQVDLGCNPAPVLFFSFFFLRDGRADPLHLSRGSDSDLAGTVKMTDGDAVLPYTTTAAMTSTASKQAISSSQAIKQYANQTYIFYRLED